MGLEISKRAIDTKKNFQEKKIKVEKKSETSDQRLWRNTRFLKAVGTGLMLGMAGMGGAMADQSRSLQSLSSSDNATGLSPVLGLGDRYDLQGRTPLSEFDPSKVMPEFLDPLRKVGGQDPEQLIRNGQQGIYKGEPSSEQRELEEKRQEPLLSNEKKVKIMRTLMEKTKTDPEARERVKQLLENWQQKEQESSVSRRKRAIPGNFGGTSIVFVHGSSGLKPKRSGEGWNCSQYWGDAISFLDSRWLGDFRTIKYYNGDTNCTNGNDEGRYSSDLHDPLYKSNCIDFHAGPVGTEGTNDESLYHLSCLFSQYLYQNFGQSNRDVILVGHSMGGIIIRETMFQVQTRTDQSPFPTTIGHVTDAITFNTPHGGVFSGSAPFFCDGCTQVAELGGDLIDELRNSGQNPQTSGGFTDWTVIGSECDGVVGSAKAIDMHASHAVVYVGDSNSCYDHGSAIHDTNENQDALQYYCDTSDPANSPCDILYNTGGNWVYRENSPRGLLELYNAINGKAS